MKTHKNLCQCGSSKFFIEEKLLGSTVIFFDMERREVDYCSMYDSAIHRPAKTKTCVVCLKKSRFDYQEIEGFEEVT